MTLPMITIGIATYDAEKTLKKAVHSALNQRWRPLEIIVVDDCSKDRTQKILIDLAYKHKEIKYFINDKNFGIAFVRNKIINNSRGEFLAFFDDDDESLQNRLIMQYQRIVNYEKNFSPNSPVICHTSRKVFYPNGVIQIHPTIGTNINNYSPSGSAVAERILLGKPLKDGYGSCPTCSQMARLSTYKEAGGFDNSFRRSEDTELCIKLALLGAHFVGIEAPLVNQIMTNSPDKSIDIEFKYTSLLIKKYENFIKKKGDFKFCLKWLKIKYQFSQGNFFKMTINFFYLFIQNPFETFRRLINSFPRLNLNINFSNFHKGR